MWVIIEIQSCWKALKVKQSLHVFAFTKKQQQNLWGWSNMFLTKISLDRSLTAAFSKVHKISILEILK